MLLLITGSGDGTSDLLVSEIGGENVFRFNYDLFNDYKLEFKPDYWRITNPTGHSVDSDSVTSCFWWKAFNFYLVDQEKLIIEEVKYIFREIYHWCRLRGLIKGTPHDFHNHMGKMNLLSIASKHFKTPLTLTTFNLEGVNSLRGVDVVAKSFTSGLTETNKALATTAVDKTQLHPNYPWFLQEIVVSKADITIFVCGNEYFTYSRDRSNLKGLDWRVEQDYTGQKKEWFRIELSPKSTNAVSVFCKEIGVTWGRMDLMEVDGELIFLEFNANGQWVFLDYSGEDGLVKTVANYLMKKEGL
jgi:hypothetical protein